MDFSQEYIKMCEKAVEIQEAKPKGIDRLSHAAYGWCYPQVICPKCEVETDSNYCPDCGSQSIRRGRDRDIIARFSMAKDDIWLPRQDQLQEMLNESPRELALSFGCFVAPFAVLDNPYTHQFTTMEQLWLAYLMETKFEKHWNGEDWIIQT